MANLFGNKSGVIGSMELLFGAIYILGAMMFRKFSNENLGRGFSVIGAGGLSCIIFILLRLATEWSLKYLFGIGLVGWVIGGFLLADLIGDGESDG